jgi:hypothetical protein
MSPLTCFSTLYLNPSSRNRTRRGKKKYTDGEERNKIVFADDMIIYIENSKE